MRLLRSHLICGALLLIALFAAACSPVDDPVEDSAIEGRLLVWHSYGETATASLDRAFERFANIYPGLSITGVSVPPEEIRERYIEAVSQALGPDLIIGAHEWIPTLAAEGLIRDISGDAPNLDRYLTAAVETVRFNDGVYGLPFGVEPVALYYNRNVVAQPPTQIDDLLVEAAAGRAVGLPTRFERAFWGVAAFGGRLFDENGAVVLDRGGFASWLNWLKTAQESPGFYLSTDTAVLRALFAQGIVTYFVGTPDDLPYLRETIGAEAVGVALLPAGPGGAAAPLLYTDAIMFSQASSPRATIAALALGQFLTNNEQSAIFIREFQHVPANRNVRIDAATFPIVGSFFAQARSAIPVTNSIAFDLILVEGSNIYARVLDGIISAGDAASELTTTINTALDLAPATIAATENCTLTGEIILWHAWEDASAAFLRAAADAFTSDCPDVTVTLVQFGSDAAIFQSYQALASQPFAPDMLLINSDYVLPLASQNLIRPLSSELAQFFMPTALETVRYQDRLYGLPVSLSVNALYYNAERVTDPAVTIDDLFADANATAALPTTFQNAYWGASAYGAALFDTSGRLLLDRGGLTDWLARLQAANRANTAILSESRRSLETRFLAGDAAYYVGQPDAYPRLAAALGDALRVTTLPAGTSPALPILKTSVFVFTAPDAASAGEPPSALFTRFATYITSAEQQSALLEATFRVPTNVNLQLGEGTPDYAFRMQARQAITLPNIPQRAALLDSADDLFRSVIFEGDAPAEAVSTFVDAINDANNIAPATPTAVPEITVDPSAEVTPELTPELTEPPVAS